MGLYSKLNVSEMLSLYSYKGSQFYTDSDKLTSTLVYSADTFIQSDLNEENSNQTNNNMLVLWQVSVGITQ